MEENRPESGVPGREDDPAEERKSGDGCARRNPIGAGGAGRNDHERAERARPPGAQRVWVEGVGRSVLVLC